MVVQWRTGESNEQDECHLAVPQSGISPSCRPSAVHFEEGTFLLFFTSCQVVVWASDTLPVVLFLSLPQRGTPFLFFLVYRILMILIIAIIINIIMIAIVTVNVVITGIIMKTCLFFIIAVFIYVIINDVTVFGFVHSFNQSESVRLRQSLFFFHVLETVDFFFDLFFLSPIFQLYWEEEPSSAGQDS